MYDVESFIALPILSANWTDREPIPDQFTFRFRSMKTSQMLAHSLMICATVEPMQQNLLDCLSTLILPEI